MEEALALMQAMNAMQIPYDINEGDGAFYGRKLDFLYMHFAWAVMQLVFYVMQLTASALVFGCKSLYTALKHETRGGSNMQEIIKVSHLTKKFKELTAVNDISFSVQKGELFGFLGENGAGKTTTINMLCTLLTPTDGEVTIAGCKLGKEDNQIKHRIGVVYQDNCLDEILTVKQNLMSRGALYENDKETQKKNLERVCDILELGELLNRRYGKLSGGQKRRCEIARALLHTPDILFLDEPTTGLDPASRQSVWETIGRLQKELGMTVFLTTHYMEEAAKAKHIGIMEKGRLVQFGTPFELKERFAKDKLLLVPGEGKEQHLQKILREQGIGFKSKDAGLRLALGSTMEALPVLSLVKEYISGFEVIQGTMDDVFLNATKEACHE